MKRQAGQVVAAARDLHKVTGPEIIHSLINHFTELHGDRLGEDDPAIIGGIGLFHDLPVTVITTDRGQSAAERIAKHFGCPTPAGYRKSLRLIKQAAKFHRPVICLVNTPGAYPGQSAEEHGQGRQSHKTCWKSVRSRLQSSRLFLVKEAAEELLPWPAVTRFGCWKIVPIPSSRRRALLQSSEGQQSCQ